MLANPQLAGSLIRDAALTFCVTPLLRRFWYVLAARENGLERSDQTAGSTWLMRTDLSLGLLIKGPVILVLCGLTAATCPRWQNRFSTVLELKPLAGSVLKIAIAAPRYLLREVSAPGFLNYFLVGGHFQRYLIKAWQVDLCDGVKDQPLVTIWGYTLVAAFLLSLIVSLLLFAKLRKTSNEHVFGPRPSNLDRCIHNFRRILYAR